jgi:hypothetical protein
MGRLSALGWIVAASLIAACGGHVAQPPQSASSASPTTATSSPAAAADEKVLFAREAALPLHGFPITVLEGAVSATIEGAATPKVISKENDAGELLTRVEVPIGAKEPATCIFRTGRVDVGGAMQQMLAAVATGPALGGHEFSPTVHVGVIDGVPILAAEARYIEEGAPSLAKVAIAPSDAATILCLHFEGGYRATFGRMVEHLTASLRAASAPASSRWHEVRIWQKGDTTVGYSEIDVFDTTKKGQAMVRALDAAFLERKDGWLGIDAASTVTYDAKGGEVAEVKTAYGAGGKLTSSMTLTRTRAREYAYQGEQGEAAVKGSFKTKLPITTDASRAPQLRTLNGGRRGELRFQHYNDLVNPTGPTEVVVKRGAGRTVTIQSHGRTRSCILDGNGLCEREEDAEGFREARIFGRGNL